jgi:hypothetical protein
MHAVGTLNRGLHCVHTIIDWFNQALVVGHLDARQRSAVPRHDRRRHYHRGRHFGRRLLHLSLFLRFKSEPSLLVRLLRVHG